MVLQRTISILFAATATALLTLPSLAQIPVDYPALGVTPMGGCDTAPSIDDALAQSSSIGVVDVWIYPTMDAGAEIRGVRLGATWPEEWTVLDLEICHGTLIEGGLVFPGTGLGVTLDLVGEPIDRPAIRLRLDATNPGRVSLLPDPATGDFDYQKLDGSWVDFYGHDARIYAYAEIGERCGWAPLGRAGDWCELFVFRDLAGSVSGMIGSLSLQEGTTYVDTVLASGPEECTLGAPECGGGVPPAGWPCYGFLASDVPWISLEVLEIVGPAAERYQVTVDATGLAEGNHSGNLIVRGACESCRDVCRSIDLFVGPVTVEPTTWGRIKVRYRD
jgi:hypothetical protein